MKCMESQQNSMRMVNIVMVVADLVCLFIAYCICKNSNNLSENFLLLLSLSLKILHTVSFQEGLPIFWSAYSSTVLFFLSLIF